MVTELSDRFAAVGDFIGSLRFDDIPAPVVAHCQDLLLDLIGVAAVATTTEAGRIAAELARAMFAAGSPGEGVGLIFDGSRLSAAGAAYAAATAIDNFDAHDGMAPCKGHIGVATLPALLSFAQLAAGCSGREALTCLTLGYELASRAGLALHESVDDYHTSGAWNTLAVAAIGARLLGLSQTQCRHALGIAEFHGPRSQMMREIDYPSMLHDGSGWGALAGVTATFLAKRGFNGAPAITIEGADVAHHWQDLGQTWLTLEQYIKPYPVCRWAHALVDGALMLKERHGLEAGDIAGVTLATFAESARLASAMPETTAQAQYSLAFPVAAALARGRVGVDEVTGTGLDDTAIAGLVGRTTVHEEARHSDRFPDGRWGDITLELTDGSVLRSGDINARGGPDQPLGRAAVTAKFRDYAVPIIGEGQSRAIEAAVFSMDHPGARFDALVDLLLAPIETRRKLALA